MRKVIYLYFFYLLIFLKCTPKISFIPKTMTFGIFTFNKYTEKGFLFTPQDYMGDYESIGFITVTLLPSAKYAKVNTGKTDSVGAPIFESVWDIDKMDVNEALDSIFLIACNFNANAIVGLKINEISHAFNVGSGVPQVTVFGYRIDGFAIKRLGAFKHNQDSGSISNDQHQKMDYMIKHLPAPTKYDSPQKND